MFIGIGAAVVCLSACGEHAASMSTTATQSMTSAYKSAMKAIYDQSGNGLTACSHFTKLYAKDIVVGAQGFNDQTGHSDLLVSDCPTAIATIGGLELLTSDHSVHVSAATVNGHFGTLHASYHAFGGSTDHSTVYLIFNQGQWLVDADTDFDPEGATLDAAQWPESEAANAASATSPTATTPSASKTGGGLRGAASAANKISGTHSVHPVASFTVIPLQRDGQAPEIDAQQGFETPSGNIVCDTGAFTTAPTIQGIECYVLSTHAADGKSVGVWYMQSTGTATHGTVLYGLGGIGVANKLGYGASSTFEGITCATTDVALTCRNKDSHGFVLAVRSQTTM